MTKTTTTTTTMQLEIRNKNISLSKPVGRTKELQCYSIRYYIRSLFPYL